MTTYLQPVQPCANRAHIIFYASSHALNFSTGVAEHATPSYDYGISK